MGTINKKVQFGWYGSCETIKNCEALSLDKKLSSTGTNLDRTKLSSIVRVSNLTGHAGNVFEKFTPYNKNKIGLSEKVSNSGKTFDHFFNNSFQELECGRGYIVVARPTTQGALNIQDFHIADETSSISSTCADDIVCTKAGNLVYDVSMQSSVVDQENGVVSSNIKYTGKLSVPKPNSESASIPYAVDLLHNDELIGHITLTGSISAPSVVYLKVTEGEHINKCLSGEIANNVCELKE